MSARMRPATTSSAVTLAVLMMLGTTARLSASPIATPISYSTSGSVDSFGVVGEPIVVYQAVQYGTTTTGSTFDLGQFKVASNAGSGSATYTNVPFQIALRIQSVDGAAPSPNTNDTPVLLQGTLSAVVTDGQLVSLSTMFSNTGGGSGDPPPYPSTIAPFRIGDYSGYLKLSTSGNDGAPIQSVLNVTPVPEPASMLVFAAAAGLVAFRARRSRS